MARVKLSEFKAKTIISDFLGREYPGLSFDTEMDDITKLDGSIKENKKYVVKVDEGIKKRFKQGLVKLDLVGASSILDAITELKVKGYRHFIVEEMIPHENQNEKYIALERTALGTVIYYSNSGGVEIEENAESVKRLIYKDAKDAEIVAVALGVETEGFVEKLIEAFDIFYFSFLEINPLVVEFKIPYILDIAGEVDSAAAFFVNSWEQSDFRYSTGELTSEEKNIEKLSEKSQASFKLVVLNPQGSIFMLLSGGGASIVLADEVYNLGRGKDLANYGEYSGNPNEEETYIYTQNILSLLLSSTATGKVLIIAGGVANFTDV